MNLEKFGRYVGIASFFWGGGKLANLEKMTKHFCNFMLEILNS